MHRDGLVLLVHRPKYDDWTFPKGKAEPDESDLDCALREVREETGLVCATEQELPQTHYADRFGLSNAFGHASARIPGTEAGAVVADVACRRRVHAEPRGGRDPLARTG